ncbi:MAG: hypothetical protein ABIT83_09770 [Massilia sp.]
MTAFLFLQKFDDGAPAAMPFQEVMKIFSRVGKAGSGRGDIEFTLPPDTLAAGCTVVGDPASGALCIGFERPRFDAGLRALVWECMERLGCAVFDDTLDTACTLHGGGAALPPAMLLACATGARQAGSAQQLWPAEFEPAVDGPARPALAYRNPNALGPNFQLFDHGDLARHELYIELGLHPAACNPGTLRVLRNLEARVDSALAGNPGYAVLYRFPHQETPLALLESARVAASTQGATIISAPPGTPPPQPRFIADRGIYDSEAAQSQRFVRLARDTYQLELDGGLASVDTVDGLLDSLHAAYRVEREAAGEPFSSKVATTWAKMAGAYLGTVIRKQIGAQWGYVARGQQRILALRTHTGRICCPHHLVLDHIINGGASHIGAFVGRLLTSDLSATPRREDLVCLIPKFCKLMQDSAGELPLHEQLSPERFDFSLASLARLDQYLALVRGQGDGLSDQQRRKVVRAAGAYLGETVRGNTADPARWQWVAYDDFARLDPGFAARRPRALGFMAFLDSAEHTAYPLAHVEELLNGANVDSAIDFARQLTGQSAPPAQEETAQTAQAETARTAPAQTTPTAPASGLADVSSPPPSFAVPAPSLTADDEAQAETLRIERQVDAAGKILRVLPQILTVVLLAFVVNWTLNELARFSQINKPLYGAWLLTPYLAMAWACWRTDRTFLRQSAVLCASLLLAFFASATFGVNLPAKPGPPHASVLLWVPLVQVCFVGLWMRALNREW